MVPDFAQFCLKLRLDNGLPLKLEGFERKALGDYFDGATETVIIVPKKNGKTTLLAALALFHLSNVPEAECVIVAASRDQAEILFRQATAIVKRSGLNDFDVKTGYRQIRFGAGRIRVLAADANTADGVIPTMALVDELHRHRSGELYGILRDGLGPRSGRMVTISTAGAALDSPLGVLRRKAHELPGFRRDPARKYNYARSEDDSFVLHEWCLDPGDDVDDIAVVKKANPASWQTLAALRRRHDSPSTTPWQWLRFGCGIWTEGEEPWIAPAAWDVLADPALVIGPDEPAWLGVDIGVRHDSTALVLFAPRQDQPAACKATILRPPGDGSLPLERVEQTIRDLCLHHRVQAIVYDPWSFTRSAQILEAEGLHMLEFPQSPERMSMASATLYQLIESGGLSHDGDPELRAHVLAGITKETERGWRLQKDPKSHRAIDALIALAIVAHVALANTAEDVPRFISLGE